MSANSAIQWTDHTFNPWWGCIRVSPGCEHCYAETFAKRLGFDIWGPAKTTDRRVFGEKHWAAPLKWNRDADREGRRRRVFCASMADVFEDHPAANAERPKLWELIRATPWLDWQLLTKRPENIVAMLPADWEHGYANVWLGTTVESQESTSRIAHLLDRRIGADVVRFLSCEPLLGPVDLREWVASIEWIIIGGESGPKARPFNLAWARSLVAQCRAGGSAPFVKQLGRRPVVENDDKSELWPGGCVPLYEKYWPAYQGELAALDLVDAHGGDISEFPSDLRIREFPTPSPFVKASLSNADTATPLTTEGSPT
jgi:protein gp37